MSSNETSPVTSPVYRERLRPALWVYFATALVIPASLLVFLPISLIAGIVAAVLLYGAILVVLLTTTATVEVTADELHAGRAHLPRRHIAGARGYRGEEARAERGVRLDMRAWLLLRGWIDPIVRIDLNDPDDPTPYWLVSTRHPEELVAALKS
jgi:hypothetical protein